MEEEGGVARGLSVEGAQDLSPWQRVERLRIIQGRQGGWDRVGADSASQKTCLK